jgi:L-arabinose isomerase
MHGVDATTRLFARTVRPRIGLLPTGHFYYWDQFPGLKARGQRMYTSLCERLGQIGEVVAPDLVDTREKAAQAGEFFRVERPDIVLVFPFGYTTGMCVVPAVRDLSCPIRIVNAHEDSSYDYTTADTEVYLHHEGVCCIPEYSYALKSIGKTFRVRTGHFGDERLWAEIRDDCMGAAVARAFRGLNFGVIGETYTDMADMAIDEQRLLNVTGKLLVRPEVEEIEEAFARVTDDETREMLDELRTMYDVDETVRDEHMEISARLAVAYDAVVTKHDVSGFGFYWWGEKDSVITLRSEAALAVSRLAALGRPGVTEGDVKTAMAMKIMDLLGAGGMFVEFFAMDFDENFILMGHDGPANVNLANGRPRLRHLDVHHGKSGQGLGIDFDIRQGPVTLLNLTQTDADGTFKLICSVGEVVAGPVLRIGNPNCRVRVQQPIHDFMEDWCQQGPSHHIALGLGDRRGEIDSFAEAMGMEFVAV